MCVGANVHYFASFLNYFDSDLKSETLHCITLSFRTKDKIFYYRPKRDAIEKKMTTKASLQSASNTHHLCFVSNVDYN